MDSRKAFAVITGASLGLGRAFAYELAKRKYNLILVSLSGEGLDDLALELRSQEDVEVEYYETDLSDVDNILELTGWINNHYNISLLINNAGLGGTRKFMDVDADYINNILQVNVVALSLMTHQLLPNLLGQPEAFILNVSSLSAFSPMGYKTVYPASKTFVSSFTYGLKHELRNTNVFVAALFPGPIHTNGDVSRRLKKQGFLARLAIKSPSTIAKSSLNQLLRKKSFILVGLTNRLTYLLMTFLPNRIKIPLSTRVFERELIPDQSPSYVNESISHRS